MSDNAPSAELSYTPEHEWVLRTGPTTVRIGITDFAQGQLGDVVFVQLPSVGDEVTAGTSLGEVESTKSVSDVFAPLTAKVVAVNEDLDAAPEKVNSGPYTDGWLVELEVDTEATLDAAVSQMLDADGYAAITAG
ncbi:glycine cleavage system protein GcvH [Rhodococcus sp. BP-252]|uniref:Glycine cleavage system H protein n=1 Tax=Rhodococcoides kyotonense TaxID=398843 RepID=A0A177Y772_9NOCA|nr:MULTISPECIES: glycine cleavage system protein GcvH [Rhodococcus]MBY6410161.1 glycine cleavage system protein GcvH [Rhodococcus sp. BP-320]MBY6415130.1 glycine cleavage system protein GcvH [Rhodococcus sp. BP-321]MBY6421453.1 glycine cleavage system protein GcvH [Rhodococcus sp. BP-324]MBY6425562.1 glycine cleavage system protein GcvH [Rhodococcus sp. BP-323]MBY6430026.1 glycine cleavage system protein GcvH [Rhodococcus sp. BP-322]